jgi:hypothetical protein
VEPKRQPEPIKIVQASAKPQLEDQVSKMAAEISAIKAEISVLKGQVELKKK